MLIYIALWLIIVLGSSLGIVSYPSVFCPICFVMVGLALLAYGYQAGKEDSDR